VHRQGICRAFEVQDLTPGCATRGADGCREAQVEGHHPIRIGVIAGNGRVFIWTHHTEKDGLAIRPVIDPVHPVTGGFDNGFSSGHPHIKVRNELL
jgi:hypothetical protein